ncbi:MAG: HAMP domain-containing histidine kinase, partial [Acidimicrobiia bacterium]|nr:HAMP domain-containing histidine kinase [Acidimicrobiia bacterium]
AGTLASITDRDDIQQAILEELTVGGEPVGLLVGINRLGDISAFGEADVRVLATLASQLSTTLENGRLSDTLDELRQLKEQLEALIESKDRLVASVSHELRTPLTGVIGLASLVRDSLTENVEPESAEMLDLIVEQGNELANIIEDLLTHARAEAGTLSLRPERFDLNAEMVTVAASHELPVPETIGPVWAFADPLRTRQIIRNLVTNARRYGGPNISIELSLGTHTVAAAVVDDGEGVPSDEAVHIFEPYRSAHDQRGQPGSVGLGLAVSRSMAHMMGGDLTYDRVDGRTRFTLSLPRLPLEVMGETDLQGILAAQ